ncbi:hypothetical protein [Novosphingobium beihaiensis]|uniref:hypothetical protein n=1 Tax=Novosphingobium beihaiensis TaxID=2930389 RepID=UPI001FBB0ABE|nr:hypothetical protein [Novosphingobium beihaiensis]
MQPRFHRGRRWPVWLGAMLMLGTNADLVASAELHGLLALGGPDTAAEARDAERLEASVLVPGMRCRSRFDGSNRDLVEQVKARAGAEGFSHVETSASPLGGDDYALTMMFLDGPDLTTGTLREARAVMNADTCRASLRSIS